MFIKEMIQEKIDRFDFMNIENFCIGNKIINEVKSKG